MKDYSAMSDLEINAQVSRELYGPVSRGHQMELASGTVDYCNNPEHAWPIIVENEIALISSWNEEGVWGATVAPWNFAPSSSTAEGWREPSPPAMVDAP